VAAVARATVRTLRGSRTTRVESTSDTGLGGVHCGATSPHLAPLVPPTQPVKSGPV